MEGRLLNARHAVLTGLPMGGSNAELVEASGQPIARYAMAESKHARSAAVLVGARTAVHQARGIVRPALGFHLNVRPAGTLEKCHAAIVEGQGCASIAEELVTMVTAIVKLVWGGESARLAGACRLHVLIAEALPQYARHVETVAFVQPAGVPAPANLAEELAPGHARMRVATWDS